MTVREWEAETDPVVLLSELFPMRGLDSTVQQTRASRLYLLNCARRVWDQLPLVGQALVEISERILEREPIEIALRKEATALAEDLTHRRGEPDEVLELGRRMDAMRSAGRSQRIREERTFDPETWGSLAHLVYFPYAGLTPHYRRIADEHHSLELVREIFGCSIRRIKFESTWLSGSVVGIARGIYSDREFSTMPLLADALEETDCRNEFVLDHCRGECEHVRGCWVLDGLLKKRK